VRRLDRKCDDLALVMANLCRRGTFSKVELAVLLKRL
jgi:hypothetical protein